ncbi:hypothetical protein ACOME3_001144 [Neoechinorhynchus agilis]
MSENDSVESDASQSQMDKLSSMPKETLLELFRKQLILQKRLKARIESLELKANNDSNILVSSLKLELSDYRDSVAELKLKLDETDANLESMTAARLISDTRVSEISETLTQTEEKLSELNKNLNDHKKLLEVANDRVESLTSAKNSMDNERTRALNEKCELETRMKILSDEIEADRSHFVQQLSEKSNELQTLKSENFELKQSILKSESRFQSLANEYEQYRTTIAGYLKENTKNDERDTTNSESQTDDQLHTVDFIKERLYSIEQSIASTLVLFEKETKLVNDKLVDVDERVLNIINNLVSRMTIEIKSQISTYENQLDLLREKLEESMRDCCEMRSTIKQKNTDIYDLQAQIKTLERYRLFSQVKQNTDDKPGGKSSYDFFESIVLNKPQLYRPIHVLFKDDQDVMQDQGEPIHLSLLNDTRKENGMLKKRLNLLEEKVQTYEQNEQRLMSLHRVEYVKNVILKFITLLRSGFILIGSS